MNQIDNRADVETEFADDLLTVTVTKDGQPYDLNHMITLHILVPDAPALTCAPSRQTLAPRPVLKSTWSNRR